MEFRLKNIVPDPLKGLASASSDIWNKEISFNKGSYIHINAPSGTGKTTLIHLLYGLRKDYSGELWFSGANTSDFVPDRWSDMRAGEVAIVFQDLRLFPDLSGMDNILVKANLKGNSDPRRIEQMASILGVKSLLQKPCALMSQGEKQRISIIRALVQPFSWLLLDEPFSHLDDANIHLAKQLISETCKDQNAGMIMASLGSDFGMHYDQKYEL